MRILCKGLCSSSLMKLGKFKSMSSFDYSSFFSSSILKGYDFFSSNFLTSSCETFGFKFAFLDESFDTSILH